MKAYNYSEARKRLSEVLDIARNEEVLIKRRGEKFFLWCLKKPIKSPFDIPGIMTKATTEDILAAVKKSRSRS
ncbi:MAG: type II toxin-antitoxin system Phd/YefM family antitoxin [Thermodesulfobacteriota bacterium]